MLEFEASELLPSSGHIFIDVWLDMKVQIASSLKIFEKFEVIPKFHDLGAVCSAYNYWVHFT